MPTYLLTWNPKRSPFADISRFAEGTADGTPQTLRWSIGTRKTIRRGDRLFLLRQGKFPKGIVAAGRATSDNFEDDHWDESRDGTAWYVRGQYERFLDPALDEPLSTDFTSGPLSRVLWRTQTSGTEVPPEAAELLEEVWADHLGEVSGRRKSWPTRTPRPFPRGAWCFVCTACGSGTRPSSKRPRPARRRSTGGCSVRRVSSTSRRPTGSWAGRSMTATDLINRPVGRLGQWRRG